MNRPEFIHRAGYNLSHTRFRVTISKPGPLGGKRPPLIDCSILADSYDEAVEFAEQKFLSRTKTEVSAG